MYILLVCDPISKPGWSFKGQLVIKNAGRSFRKIQWARTAFLSCSYLFVCIHNFSVFHPTWTGDTRRYVYLNNRPANAWFLEQNSRKVAKELLADITSLSKEVERAVRICFGLYYSAHKPRQVGTLHKTMDKLTRRLKQHSHKDVEQSKNELRQMFKDNSDELSYNIFGILINCVPNWSHGKPNKNHNF